MAGWEKVKTVAAEDLEEPYEAAAGGTQSTRTEVEQQVFFLTQPGWKLALQEVQSTALSTTEHLQAAQIRAGPMMSRITQPSENQITPHNREAGD